MVVVSLSSLPNERKEMRNISLNAHYIVLFQSPKDKQQVSILARQLNPGGVQEFMKSYKEATSTSPSRLPNARLKTDDRQ